MQITIVRFSGGFAGKTYSDRWNVVTLRGMGHDLSKCLTDGQFRHWRRQVKRLGFVVALRSKEAVSWGFTRDEVINMGGYERIEVFMEARRARMVA